MTKRNVLIFLGIVIIGIIAITAVALVYENNPPVVKEPPWDSPQTRALAVRACFDCHSNQTLWPWYDKLPFGSWLAVFDTIRGRERLNFSEWGVARTSGEGGRGEGGGRGGDNMSRVIQSGSMPPAIYTVMHPNAILTDQEKQQLINGLAQSLK